MRLFGLITLSLIAMAVIAITPVLSQNSGEVTVAKDNSGMGEAIKIHGDWKVKVIDPETGTENLYAFKNEFLNPNVLLLAILGEAPGYEGEVHKYDPDGWRVTGNVYGSQDSVVYSWSSCLGENVKFEIVTVDGTLNANDISELRLSDECVVEANGQLIQVSTYYNDPVYDSATNFGLFTHHSLGDEAIPVQKGQTVSFDVLISFN